MEETLLKLEDIHVHYGGVKALDGVSVFIKPGELVALMGPNGAGKSTVLKTIFGLTPISSGVVKFKEKKIRPVPHEVVNLGISLVPQGRRVFTHLTVEENVEIGGVILSSRQELKRRTEEVLHAFPVLQAKRKVKSGSLSGGQQQMLAIARGLMSNPKVLLLDEPTLGLAPIIVKEIFQKITEIKNSFQTAVFIVEHNIKSVVEIVDRAYVLSNGRVVAEGPGKALINSDVLEKVFLGLPLD